MQSSDSSGVIFRTLDAVNFTENKPDDPLEISVFQRDENTSEPTFFLLKKNVMASAGSKKIREVLVGEPEQFLEVDLVESNVLEITDIKDDNGNKYYHVPSLASDTIFLEEENTDKRNPFYNEFSESTPYVLKLLRTSRRFTTRINSDNTTTIEFGALDKIDDEIIIPNLNNVGRILDTESAFEVAYDPSNFLKTKSYGEAPSNTVLNIEYYVGGGVSSNVPSNTLVTITNIEYGDQNEYLDEVERTILNTIKSSVKVNNPSPIFTGIYNQQMKLEKMRCQILLPRIVQLHEKIMWYVPMQCQISLVV